MLRASISRRESSSICAFCQHRLSLRLATTQTRRQLSSTRSLGDDDGWGSWGTRPKTSTPPKQDDFLSPHEILARQRLLANQQAEQAPEPPKPKPVDNGIQARHVWDARKQREVEASLRRDGITLQNDAPGSATGIVRRQIPGPGRPFRRPVPLEFNSTGGRREDTAQQGAFSRNTLGAAEQPFANKSNTGATVHRSGIDIVTELISPRPADPNEIQKPRDNNFYPAPMRPARPSHSRSDWPSHGRSRRPPLPLGADNAIRPARPSEDESNWGLLTRKQPPPKSSSQDFWNAVQSGANGLQEPKSKGPDVAGGAPGRSNDRDSWAAMDTNPFVRRPSTSKSDMDDWGKEFRKLEPRSTEPPKSSEAQEDSPKPAETLSDVTSGFEELGQKQSFKGQDRDRGRDRRATRFEQEERGGGGGGGGRGRGKRSSRRGSRFEDDEDEGGFDYDQYQERRRLKAQRKAQREAEKAGPTPIRLPELITITELAHALKVEPNLFLNQLGELGFEGVKLDSLMAGETAALVAQEYGFEPTVEAGADRDLKPRPPPEDPSILPQRPPVVTIMGHVDHGKTTLLDYLRKSSIAAQEHGGITQRIGAFSVKLSTGKQITFLDTPGHAAFLTMRQRGAYVTDIVVLVVAADDSVKPQTIEAIKHARGAKVPMIVAINKIDKDGARIDQVKHDLAREGVEIEDFGGDVQVVCVSGKTGQGMDDLEENILALSEILDHRAELDGPAEGWILESSLKPIGKAATVLVKRGTVRPGDYIVAGLTWAKIRHLRSEAGVDIDEATPGTPVEILGWKDLPAAGDQVIQAPDESRARDAVEYREGLREREKDAAAYEEISEARKALQEKRAREKAAAEGGKNATAESLPEEENGAKMVNFVVKGDLHGSVEAVCAAIQELGNHEVRPRILRSGTGPIHEFDVEHAATSKSIIVNFATTTPGYVRNMAEEQGVQILDHNVIYHLVDDVKAKLSEYLAPEVTSRVLGEAEVLQIFPINIKGRKYKNIAGCRVRNGLISRNSLFRVYRGGEKIYDGKLETLKHLKKDISEVHKGTECGIGFEEFQDFEVGDQIQAYEEVKTKRTL
ncbi:initiation factor 2 [Hypoxylon sp. NC0597]|nr:initiation factor 2 [Hypoxylon sp. NC0597]